MGKTEKLSVKVTFDEGRKIVNLDKRAIRKAASKEAWLKEVMPGTKNFGVDAAEIEKALGSAFDTVRGEAEQAPEKEAKAKK